MTDAANPSGLSDEEAQEFHQYFIQGYLLWAVGAFFAHSLVWIWRPWFFPGAEGSTGTLDGVKSSVYTVISQLS